MIRAFICLGLLSALSLQGAGADSLIAQGDALDAALKTEQALKVYLEAEKQEPNNPGLLIKIAKQYGESMTGIKDAAARLKAGETALAYSQRALKQAPMMADAHLAVAICYGRLLDLVPARTRVEYSRRVKDGAEQAVKLAPDSDYAWHMLGRWNQAVATMDGLTKVIVKIVYGGLPSASLEEAARCFEKAAKLRADRVSHQIELGRTYAMLGRKDDARQCIEQGLNMPSRERDDPETKLRGRETLEKL